MAAHHARTVCAGWAICPFQVMSEATEERSAKHWHRYRTLCSRIQSDSFIELRGFWTSFGEESNLPK
jgi:hypothetical protein